MDFGAVSLDRTRKGVHALTLWPPMTLPLRTAIFRQVENLDFYIAVDEFRLEFSENGIWEEDLETVSGFMLVLGAAGQFRTALQASPHNPSKPPPHISPPRNLRSVNEGRRRGRVGPGVAIRRHIGGAHAHCGEPGDCRGASPLDTLAPPPCLPERSLPFHALPAHLTPCLIRLPCFQILRPPSRPPFFHRLPPSPSFQIYDEYVSADSARENCISGSEREKVEYR